MRSDFAIFILTHGRADNVVTMDMLKKMGYQGKWYLVIDDEDSQGDLYRRNFGPDKVITFCKADVIARTDTMDNFDEHRAIVYARNESFKIARRLGIAYFMMLDDDYKAIAFRWAEDGKLKGRDVTAREFSVLLDEMIDFLDSSGADAVAFGQGGDLLGGLNGGYYYRGILRKAMNSFICRADRPIEFKGTQNEDVTTYTTLGSRGHLFFTYTHIAIAQMSTQSLSGGMTDVYKEDGTYVKSFYSVLSMPSCVSVAMLTSTNSRIHHRISWDSCVPKILREGTKKGRG